MLHLGTDPKTQRLRDQARRTEEEARRYARKYLLRDTAIAALSVARRRHVLREKDLVIACLCSHTSTRCPRHFRYSVFGGHSKPLSWSSLVRARDASSAEEALRRIGEILPKTQKHLNSRAYIGEICSWKWSVQHTPCIIDGRLLIEVRSTLEMGTTPNLAEFDKWWPSIQHAVFENVGCTHIRRSLELTTDLGTRCRQLAPATKKSWDDWARKRTLRRFDYIQHVGSCLYCDSEVYTELRRPWSRFKESPTFPSRKRVFLLYQYYDLGDKDDSPRWMAMTGSHGVPRLNTLLNLHTLSLAAENFMPSDKPRHGEEILKLSGPRSCYLRNIGFKQLGITERHRISFQDRFIRHSIDGHSSLMNNDPSRG